MKIEEYFEKFNGAAIIFDPIPSYDGDWIFDIDNLAINSLKDKDTKKNLFDEFIFNTYILPLKKIFGSAMGNIMHFKIKMLSTPKKDRNGRCLKYSKGVFFRELLSFFNQHLDKNDDNNYNKYLIDLYNNINKGNDALIEAYSNEIRKKLAKIKDLQAKELNSDYYELAFKDYEEQNKFYKTNISFKEFLNNMEIIYSDLFKGLMSLSDFFEKEILYEELYKCFDPDTFYLLFAKIIYEFNLICDKEKNVLYSNCAYLFHYKDAVKEIVKDNKKYAPILKDFITPNKNKLHNFNRYEMVQEIDELLKKHPEVRKINLTGINGEEYKNIDLINKLAEILENDVSVNWQFLPKGSSIEKRIDNKESSFKISNPLEEEQLVKEVNQRIDFMMESGFVGTPIEGSNSFTGYYAFIYSNGIVILEKFWQNDKLKPARENATYVMNIDNFIEMSKMTKTSLISYMQLIKNSNIKRIFHDNFANWHNAILKEINSRTKYNINDAVSFIDKLRGELSLEDERDI